MTDRMGENDMGRKKQISDQKRLHRERMRLQKGVFSSLANAIGNIGEVIVSPAITRATSSYFSSGDHFLFVP